MMKAKNQVEYRQNYSEIKAGKEQSDHKTTSSMTFLESQRRSQRLGCSKIRLNVNTKQQK